MRTQQKLRLSPKLGFVSRQNKLLFPYTARTLRVARPRMMQVCGCVGQLSLLYQFSPPVDSRNHVTTLTSYMFELRGMESHGKPETVFSQQGKTLSKGHNQTQLRNTFFKIAKGVTRLLTPDRMQKYPMKLLKLDFQSDGPMKKRSRRIAKVDALLESLNNALEAFGVEEQKKRVLSQQRVTQLLTHLAANPQQSPETLEASVEKWRRTHLVGCFPRRITGPRGNNRYTLWITNAKTMLKRAKVSIFRLFKISKHGFIQRILDFFRRKKNPPASVLSLSSPVSTTNIRSAPNCVASVSMKRLEPVNKLKVLLIEPSKALLRDAVAAIERIQNRGLLMDTLQGQKTCLSQLISTLDRIIHYLKAMKTFNDIITEGINDTPAFKFQPLYSVVKDFRLAGIDELTEDNMKEKLPAFVRNVFTMRAIKQILDERNDEINNAMCRVPLGESKSQVVAALHDFVATPSRDLDLQKLIDLLVGAKIQASSFRKQLESKKYILVKDTKFQNWVSATLASCLLGQIAANRLIEDYTVLEASVGVYSLKNRLFGAAYRGRDDFTVSDI